MSLQFSVHNISSSFHAAAARAAVAEAWEEEGEVEETFLELLFPRMWEEELEWAEECLKEHSSKELFLLGRLAKEEEEWEKAHQIWRALAYRALHEKEKKIKFLYFGLGPIDGYIDTYDVLSVSDGQQNMGIPVPMLTDKFIHAVLKHGVVWADRYEEPYDK